ncbi:MAG: glutathione transferase GstA [Rhodospirillaceae bacterium]
MTYQLYYAPAACSLAVHIILHEQGEAVKLTKVSTKSKKMEDGGDYLTVTPKGYVPALRLPNGEILTENAAILQYLADNKPGTVAPKAGTLARARVNEWLVYNTSEIHKTFSPLFNPATPDEQKAALKEKIAARFDFLEKHLGDGRSYLTGETFTIADAYVFVVVNWSNYQNIDLGRWPRLKAFQARVQARPHTQAAMKAEGLL